MGNDFGLGFPGMLSGELIPGRYVVDVDLTSQREQRRVVKRANTDQVLVCGLSAKSSNCRIKN